MSWQATAWAAAQTTGSPTRKVVLLALANYADADGRCWPSQKTLARDTETSERTIRRTLADLEALGLIRRIARRNPFGEVVTTAYRLHIAPPPAKLTAGDPPAKLSAGEVRRHRPLDTVSSGQSLAGKQPVNNHDPAAAPRARARGHDAAAFDSRKRRRERPSGLVTWDANDVAEAERIETDHDPATIRAAVDTIIVAGREPVPGVVAAELAEQRRQGDHQARQAAADEAHRRRIADASRVPIDPAATATALVAYPALQRIRKAHTT